MTPRPLHKWKSFWFGILVFVSLGWSWTRSEEHIEGVYWTRPQYGLGLTHEAGVVFVSFVDGDATRWGMPAWETGVQSMPLSPFTKWDFRPVSVFSVSFKGITGSGVKFAHWFLILLFLVPWVGFLVWRYRRQRKLTETNASAFS